MLKEMKERFQMELQSFEWRIPASKTYEKDFVEFRGWNGEIYVQKLGILTNETYYKKILESGICLYVDGVVVGIEGSASYIKLQKCHARQSDVSQGNTLDYPVINKSERPIFESAVRLYEQGFFTIEQLAIRVKRYIKPEEQDNVMEKISALT